MNRAFRSLLAAMSMLSAGCKTGGGQLGNANGHLAGPTAVSFPALPVGDRETLTISVGNFGSTAVPLEALSASGDFAAALAPVVDPDGGPSATPILPVNLDPGQAVAVILSFRPSAVGSRLGALTLANGTATAVSDDPMLAIPLSGAGVDPASVLASVSPLRLDFGAVGLGGASTQRFKISNPNGFAIVPRIASPTSSPAGQFALGPPNDAGLDVTAGGLAVFLDAGETAYVQVTFAPTAVAQTTGAVGVQICQACDAGQQVGLAGTGQDAALQADPNPIDFGLVLNAVEPPATVQLTVTATGDTPISIGSVRLLSPNSVFQLAANTLSGSTLQPLAARTLDLSYSPSGAPGGDRDTLTIEATILSGTPGASDRSLRLPVLGNTALNAGCSLSLTPPTLLDFGTLAPGTSFSDALLVTNRGSAPCQLSGIGLGATTDAAFSLGTSSPAVVGGAVAIPPHGTLSLPVTFSAPRNSFRYQRRGTLAFTSDDPALPSASIALAGKVLSLTGNSPWPKWRHDIGNTGQGETDTSKTSGTLLWSYQLPNAPLGVGAGYLPYPLEFPWGPMIGPEGDVYQVSFENETLPPPGNTLVAIKPSTGTLDWSLELRNSGAPNQLSALPVPTLAQDNTLYLAVPNLFAISPVERLATLLAPAQAVTNQYTSMAAVGPGGQIYVSEWSPSPTGVGPPGIDLQVFAKGMSTQSIVLPLSVVTGSGAANAYFFTGMAAVDDQGNTFWCMGGTCFKTDPAGTLRWIQPVGSASTTTAGSPVVYGTNLFYQAQSEQLDHPLGLPAAARIHNQIFILDASQNSPAPAATLLYETAPLPISDPNVVSTRTLGFNAPTLYATPAVAADGAVVFGGLDGVYCVESAPPLRGRLRWEVPLAGGTQSTPSLGADGTVYIGTAFQGLLAIDLKSGAVRWNFSLPGAEVTKLNSVSSTPALGDNVVYFTGDDGILYAVQ